MQREVVQCSLGAGPLVQTVTGNKQALLCMGSGKAKVELLRFLLWCSWLRLFFNKRENKDLNQLKLH